MKLDTSKLFLATLVTFAAIWVLCTILVVLMPFGMMSLSGHMTHMDLQAMSWTMTTTGFFVGLVSWSVVPAAIVWAIASLYNRLSMQQPYQKHA